LYNLHRSFLLSQNAHSSGSIQIQENGGSPVLFDGSLFSTRKQPAKKKQTLPLLVLLVFSVYVSLSKNALLCLLPEKHFSFSGCKGMTIF
ncbi:MAG: hypothetical protein IJ144_01525, partial [Prevotella sp.]|nr:hypothetical protein [Prevotella sp.]